MACRVRSVRLLAWGLALVAFGAMAGRLAAQAPLVPGQWYDQDKTHDATGRWDWNYWDDGPAGNDQYDPGEAWVNNLVADTNGDSVQAPPEDWGTWKYHYDMSCWAAAASNLVRYVSGRDRYMAWMYDSDWPDGSTYTWQDGGGTSKALDAEGYVSIETRNNAGGSPAGSWTGTGITPYLEIRDALEDRMPVSLGVTWHAATPADVQHLITCWAIDTSADTITIADSDSDLGGGYEWRTYNYVFDATGRMTITTAVDGAPHTYGGWINNFYRFATTDWTGAGTHWDTSTTGPATQWDDPSNWAGGSAPGTMDFPKVRFTGGGEMNIDGFAWGTRCIIQSGASATTVVNVNSSGQAQFRSLDNYAARIEVNGGVLQTHHDLINDGVIVLNSGLIRSGDLCVGAVAEGTLMVLGGSVDAERLYVSQTPGSTGRVWLFDGATGVRGDMLVNAGGEVTVDVAGTILSVGHNLELDGTLAVGEAIPGPEVTVVRDLVIGPTNAAAQAAFTGSSLEVGHDLIVQQGTLEVTDTPVQIGWDLLADSDAGSHITLRGSDATLHYMEIGRSGRGFEAHLSLLGHSGTASHLRTVGLNTELYVGYDGRGILRIEDGGSIRRNDPARDDVPDLILGQSLGASGRLELVDGTVWVDDLCLGVEGFGRIEQDSGTLTALGPLRMAEGEHASAHYKLGGGTLQVRRLERGLGDSTLYIDGGTLLVSSLPGEVQRVGSLYVGADAGDVGELNLAGNHFEVDTVNIGVEGDGTLILAHPDARLQVADELVVGHNGTATVNQTDGLVSAPAVYLGRSFSSLLGGTYFLTGGTLEAGELHIGYRSPGLFSQGGTATVVADHVVVGEEDDSDDNLYHQLAGSVTVSGALEVALDSGSRGRYILAGGQLETATTAVGVGGEGEFAQVDGLHRTATLRLGQGGAGTYHLTGGDLEVGNLFVGDTSTGEVIQTGGTCTLLAKLYAGCADGATGTYNQTGGSWTLVPHDIYLGHAAGGTGIYALSGGTGYANTTLTVGGTLYVGYEGTGELALGGWYTRVDGPGEIRIAAGRGTLSGEGRVDVPVVNEGEVVCLDGFLRFYGLVSGAGSLATAGPWPSGGIMFYADAVLDGPFANAGRCDVRSGADVTLNAPMTGGGRLAVDGALWTHAAIDVESLTVGGVVHVGADVAAAEVEAMAGTVDHAAGAVTTDHALVWEGGHYGLAGPGRLDAALVQLFATFDQTGGTHDAGRLRVGGYNEFDTSYGGEGTYTISGGRLDVGRLYLGDDGDGAWVSPQTGTFAITDASAEVYVSEELVMAGAGIIEAVPGAEIHMTGSAFRTYATDPARAAGLANLAMIFEGGPGVTDTFESAGRSDGGFLDNFALGRLVLGGAREGHVRFVDEADNGGWALGPECPFLLDLLINDGSSLDLGGCGLAVEAGIAGLLETWIADGRLFDGTLGAGEYLACLADPVTGGLTVETLPEPATLALVALGVVGALLRRRR